MLQALKQETDLGELIGNIYKAQKELSSVVAHEHTAIYNLINGLCNNIKNRPNGVDEHIYIPQILNYTDLAMTHILHVSDENEFLRGYYKKFITQKTQEFEARLNYVDALVQIAIALNAFNGSEGFKDFRINMGYKWKETKTIAQNARRMVKGMQNPSERYISSSYESLMNFRERLINRFHEIDRPLTMIKSN